MLSVNSPNDTQANKVPPDLVTNVLFILVHVMNIDQAAIDEARVEGQRWYLEGSTEYFNNAVKGDI